MARTLRWLIASGILAGIVTGLGAEAYTAMRQVQQLELKVKHIEDKQSKYDNDIDQVNKKLDRLIFHLIESKDK